MKYELVIFDLDGVIVDTAKYHYLAWKKLAKDEFNYDFTEEQNELFKGVSRLACMDILCELVGREDISSAERSATANRKNQYYLELINQIDESELLTGAKETLLMLRKNGIKIALGSASKNAVIILEKTGIIDYFDVIVDGNKVNKAKPDPEVFVLAARSLGVPCERCVVCEDASAGVEAAKSAGMFCIGIGEAKNLPQADLVLDNVGQIKMSNLA